MRPFRRAAAALAFDVDVPPFLPMAARYLRASFGIMHYIYPCRLGLSSGNIEFGLEPQGTRLKIAPSWSIRLRTPCRDHVGHSGCLHCPAGRLFVSEGGTPPKTRRPKESVPSHTRKAPRRAAMPQHASGRFTAIPRTPITTRATLTTGTRLMRWPSYTQGCHRPRRPSGMNSMLRCSGCVAIEGALIQFARHQVDGPFFFLIDPYRWPAHHDPAR